jgi:ribosomal protein S18 acetylase RimI-like enzyme
MPDVSIRNAVIADYPALDALYAEGDAYHNAGAPHSFAPAAEPARTRDVIQAMLDDPNQEFLVAEIGGIDVGLLRLTIRERNLPFVPKRIAVINEVVVSAEQRGTGIGHQLMARAQELAAVRGAVEIWLDVWEFNTPALGFYESLGFEPVIRWVRKEIPDR